MAVTQNTYTGNGSTTLYSFTFPYLETSDIKVTINGTLTTAYTLANATTVSFNTAPANGASIKIYRDTNSAATRSTFFPGSAIRSQDLNDNFTQSLYISQETQNFAASTDATAIAATATTALNTANNAVITAGNALTTANAATTTANAATSTANAISAVANAAMPKAGGTFTGDVTFGTTTATILPVGTTAQRPASPTTGMVRYNSNLLTFEGYNGALWGSIGGGATGSGGDTVFLENGQTVTSSYTIGGGAGGKNAVSAGPITIQSGVSVTIPSGSSWVIV